MYNFILIMKFYQKKIFNYMFYETFITCIEIIVTKEKNICFMTEGKIDRAVILQIWQSQPSFYSINNNLSIITKAMKYFRKIIFTYLTKLIYKINITNSDCLFYNLSDIIKA